MEYSPPFKKANIDGSGATGNMLTPPFPGGNGPSGTNSPTRQAEPRPPLTQPTSHLHVPMEQFTAFNEENIDIMTGLSGGRLERLAKLLSEIEFDTIIFNTIDKTIFQRRPTLMIFWFLKLLPERVFGLHLEDIVAEESLDLAEKDRSAFTANEEIIIKWLATPIPKKKRSRFYFANCDMDINSMMRFIKAWRDTPEPHLFDNITIGKGSIPAMEFCRCVEDESWPHQHDWEKPYKGNFLAMENIHYQDRQYVWKHKKYPAVVHSRFREGMLIFTCHQDHVEMLHRCCTDEEFASVERTCAMNPNDPYTLPFCAPHMTPLRNVSDTDMEKSRTATPFYYRSTA